MPASHCCRTAALVQEATNDGSDKIKYVGQYIHPEKRLTTPPLQRHLYLELSALCVELLRCYCASVHCHWWKLQSTEH